MAPIPRILLTRLVWWASLTTCTSAFCVPKLALWSDSPGWTTMAKRSPTRIALRSFRREGATVEAEREIAGKRNEEEDYLSVWTSLCHTVDLQPEGLVRLDESNEEVRGIYLNRAVKAGAVILSIPLEKCLRDDEPPTWMSTGDESSNDWAPRLAACLLHPQLKARKDDGHENKDDHTNLWLSFLPNPDILRASLPIHWDEETVQSARCTALELAVDAAYFTRANAVRELMEALEKNVAAQELEESEKKRLAQDALDVVQTRTCRVEKTLDDGLVESLRLLAPVFDFVNHRSPATAGFELEGDDRLVVRALEDMSRDQEVTIDYGESTRPAWKCLSSYGFVPTFPSPSEEETTLAEVYMDGIRYEVGPTAVPETMIAAAADSLLLDDASLMKDGIPELPDAIVELTPEIAIRLARRISDSAYYLLVDLLGESSIGNTLDKAIMLQRLEENVDDVEELRTKEALLSMQLATSLRFNQHRILLKCSLGLHDWAVNQLQS